MEIEVVKKLIRKHMVHHGEIIHRTMTAERYYRNENDILTIGTKTEEEEQPLRNADNRIPSNFHGLLVNQKASYMFTAPPLFDTKDSQTDQVIRGILGDEYPKICKDLCIHASNAGVAWIHYWINSDGNFEYGIVDAKQVVPIWSSSLKKQLVAVFRVYEEIDDEGNTFDVYEYWTNTICYAYRKPIELPLDKGLMLYRMFSVYDCDTGQKDQSNELMHGFGEVPFVPFFNNNLKTGDLSNIKRLIDTYDKVYSGFVNDLEDIQEIIFVLSGYQGTELGEFLHKLKKYKTVKVDADSGSNPGLSTLTIDIPVEAREKLLVMTRKAIFEQGQGIDPDPQNFGNSSGVALGYLYSLLELKAGLMETEFKLGFGHLVRAVCQYLGIKVEKINQIWTRTSVANDAELAAIAQQSVGVISQKTIVRNHPWVEDPEKEMDQLREEEKQKEEKFNNYPNAFGGKESDQDGDVNGKEEQ